MFLALWNRIKSLSSIWQHFSSLLDEEIPKIWWLPELPAKQHSQFSASGITFLPCLSLPSQSHHENLILDYRNLEHLSALKKPPWEFNFFHIFGISSSSRHEKRCQMLERLFWLFQCSKNPWCIKQAILLNYFEEIFYPACIYWSPDCLTIFWKKYQIIFLCVNFFNLDPVHWNHTGFWINNKSFGWGKQKMDFFIRCDINLQE